MISQSELTEHRRYLADVRRIGAYRAALAEIVKPGDVVLDLGAGTGILGYLACEAGAQSVVAIDRGDILEAARRIAADNGFSSRITHIKALSTEVALDRSVDVVVCDQMGGLVHDAGILRFFADARRRLLAMGGRLIPSSFRIFAAPVTYAKAREDLEFWASVPALSDASAMRELAVNTEWMLYVTADDVVPLSAGSELASFPSYHDAPISGSADFEIDLAGRFDGFLGWFEAQLSPSVMLTNNPWSPQRFGRWCNFYPIDHTADVEVGDRLRLNIDIRPRMEVVSWTTDIVTRGGNRQARQSTFFKTSSSDLFGRAAAVPKSDNIGMVHAALDLIDGTRTRDEIAEGLASEIGRSFVSRAHLEHFVEQVTSLVR